MNSTTKKGLLTLVFLCCLTALTIAQTGNIKGTVLDAVTKKAVPGATVKFVGTTQAVSTNKAGAFEITNIEPGKYNLEVTNLSYQNLVINGVEIEADKVVSLNVELQAGDQTIEEVVVSASTLRNTNNALISEIKSSKVVASGVSQQQIKMSQDRDAAQVMSRIPGLTIVDNRFVMVRGIPERYNQVMLNNAIAPSTEVDRRTFSFDLIPSGVLERMMIYKSGSADNPGDFAGGLVKVYTSSAAGENFTSFTVGSNIRLNTTFKPYVYNYQSPTEIFGFDKERTLSPSFYNKLANASQTESAELAKGLRNDLSTKSVTAIPDLNFGIGLGRRWEIFNGKRLSMLSQVNYSQSNQFYSRDFNTYRVSDLVVQQESDAEDRHYEKENRIGVLTNWALTLNPFHKIEFKNLFNQIGENSTILRDAVNYELSDSRRRNAMYDYRSRTIYSGQLEGNHRFSGGKTTVNWVLGSNILRENQPGLRQFTSIANAGTSTFVMQTESLYDNSRYRGKLSEIGYNNSVNIEHEIGKIGEERILLKGGYLVDYRDRDFKSGFFTYGGRDTPQEILSLPLDQVFAPENFGPGLFSITEKSDPSNNYTGTNLLSAAFGNIVLPINQFTIVAGIRGEYNMMKLRSFNATGAPLNVDNNTFTPLPFLNADYALSEEHKIRAAYGRTVNRPEFRELAPFSFYDFELYAIRVGNPNLKIANINNFDLRYEWYPRMGETISFGTFYKDFKTPIEIGVQEQLPTPYIYMNAESAYSYGIEMEVRKSLKGLTSSAFVDNLSLNLNASWIKSQVDYGNSANSGQDAQRPLQGQSPYIANAVLSYQDSKSLIVSAAYNTIGPRIFAVGTSVFPSTYELPRHALDLTISRNISKSFALKVGAQDVLNSAYRFYQDSDRDGKIDTNKDNLAFKFQRGTLITTSLTYTIK